jgi:hypothetical protein
MDKTFDTMPTIEQARNWYPDSDPVHGFDHVRVYAMAERLAGPRADLEIVQAAAAARRRGSGTEGGDEGRVTITRHPQIAPKSWAQGWDGRIACSALHPRSPLPG